jgi:hypothetical protein
MLLDSQLPRLKTAIEAETDPQFVAWRDAGSTGLMAEWLNGPSNVIVWRTSVTQDEIMTNGFDWTRVDNLSVGAARVWEWMFNNQNKSFNPSNANIRAGIEAVWKGTSADLAVRAAVYVHCKRPATRAEAVYATGTGTAQAPATLGWEGQVSDYDVTRALNA